MFAQKIRLWIVIALSLSVFFAVIIWKASSARLAEDLPSKPVLELGQQTVDLGDLRQGGRIDVAFHLVNRGGQRLQIHEVDRNCGYGEPIRQSMSLAANTGRDWVVSFEPAFETVQIVQTTSFVTSDQEMARFDLRVIATVQPSLVQEKSQAVQQDVVPVPEDDLPTTPQ